MALSTYIPVGVAVVLGLGLAGVFLAMAILFGPSRRTPVKDEPFDCGNEMSGTPRARQSVRFYRVAILFLVFDVEAALLYPWAIAFRASPTPLAFVAMVLFVVVLGVALAYVWRRKAIGWD